VKIRLNKVKYTRGDYFEEEEIKEIIEAVNKTEKYRINQLRLKLIILLCYVSGARLNELRQITIQNVYE
jgi:integrase